MKITTRITLGLALVTTLTVAALTYQLTVVEKLQGINEELSLTKLEAGRVSLRLLQRVDGVQEFVAKSLILGDADYIEQWEEWEEAVDEDLVQLAALELSGMEHEERSRISELWSDYRTTAAPLRAEAKQAGGREVAESPADVAAGAAGGAAATGSAGGAAPDVGADVAAGPGARLAAGGGISAAATSLDAIDQLLETLREHLRDLMTLTDAAVATHVRSSAEAGARAQLVSRIAAGSAVLLGTLICILLYMSISGPLRRLTGGTRELARGRFDHRLEVRGEDELSELARAFNRMARRLNELEEMKRDFVSHVSHELKGPLAAIHETILVLLDEIPGPLNEKQAHFLQLSHQSSERLSGMISNLLEVSRLEAGGAKYQPLPQDLEAIARSVLEEYEPVARERGIALSFATAAGSAALLCDGDRIREVVANLVGNALKFSPPESRVRVRLEELAALPHGIPRRRMAPLRGESPPFLLLSVEDEGVGVADSHKEGIFEKFHQVKVEGRIHGQGVGLGLSISRRNVEAHGGAVWVEDAPERGSIFRTLLPRVPTRWKAQDPWGAAPPATRIGEMEESSPPVRPPAETAPVTSGGAAQAPVAARDAPSPAARDGTPTPPPEYSTG
jgi:signal transduction histidine kinase